MVNDVYVYLVTQFAFMKWIIPDRIDGDTQFNRNVTVYQNDDAFYKDKSVYVDIKSVVMNLNKINLLEV